MKSDSGILIGSAPVFEKVSRSAVRGLWAQRSQLGLVGAHINVFTGEWTHQVFSLLSVNRRGDRRQVLVCLYG